MISVDFDCYRIWILIHTFKPDPNPDPGLKKYRIMQTKILNNLASVNNPSPLCLSPHYYPPCSAPLCSEENRWHLCHRTSKVQTRKLLKQIFLSLILLKLKSVLFDKYLVGWFDEVFIVKKITLENGCLGSNWTSWMEVRLLLFSCLLISSFNW